MAIPAGWWPWFLVGGYPSWNQLLEPSWLSYPCGAWGPTLAGIKLVKLEGDDRQQWPGETHGETNEFHC